MVLVTDIGCIGLTCRHFITNAFHGLHGRSITYACGLKLARPELDVIAAVVIGGGSLSGGEGSILGSMVGALVMAFLRNGSQQMGWPTYVQEILIGAIIVAAVAVDRWRHTQGGDE